MSKIIGVLWKKEKDGKEYYSGVLNDLRGRINIAVFKNTKKAVDTQPDMNITISWTNPAEKEKRQFYNIIGVLWKKEKDGKEYYSGVLNDLRGRINIAVFKNTKKAVDIHPDMNIVISWNNPSEKIEEETETENTLTKDTNKKCRKKEILLTDYEDVGF